MLLLLLLLLSQQTSALQISVGRAGVGSSVLPLAARQLRRYLHELDRRVPPFRVVAEPTNDEIPSVIHLAVAESCPHGASYLVSRPSAFNVSLLACDQMGQGSLFAVTDLLSSMGLFFSAEGPPFLPASARTHAVAALTSPHKSDVAAWTHSLAERVLDAASSLPATATPAFTYRGFQPWGSYPIGNDWWDRDEYRRVVETIVGLKGNWIGMHSYPCGYAYPEPGVWINPSGGMGANILPSGNLTPAAGGPPQCAASWAATNRPSYGLCALNTSSFKFGAALLFERDCFTNRELTAAGVCGVPTDGTSNAEAHNAVANLYKNVFAFAARLGVSTALGAEMPLPSDVPALAAYTDAFTRLQRLYGTNLTWYWSWSPEQWQWGKVNQTHPEVVAAVSQMPSMAAAAIAANATFGLALGGWTLGPDDNKTLFDLVAPMDWPMGALDGYLGTFPPEAEFGNLSDSRSRWSFPWSEDDLDLTAVQMWVGRNLKHAAAALAMGVSGHASLQWRTRTVSPALTAVADFPWNTSITSDDFLSAYAAAAFGNVPALGTLLRAVDSEAMPRPVHCDPGCMTANTAFCGASGEQPYAFVDEWLAQRDAVVAGNDPNALERFDYWAAHFFQLRAMARAQCGWGEYERALAAVKANHSLAVTVGFPAFSKMVSHFSQLVWGLQGAMATYGDIGVLAQLYGDVNHAAGDVALSVLEGLAGGARCGAPCVLPDSYAPTAGSPESRLRVLSVRTILERGEALNIRLHAVGDLPTVCTVFVRAMGDSTFANITLPQEGVGRAVFYAPVPIPEGSEDGGGMEWYASCVCGGRDEPLVFPPGAPSQPQTIIFF